MTAMHGSEGIRFVHHVGISVAGLDRSLAFWEALLGKTARWRGVLDAPYLARITGYPGVRIQAALVELPGGVLLELLQYVQPTDTPNDSATARPGNVHVCLRVDDLDEQWRRAVELGARPVSQAPVDITTGPNAGARAAYLRDPDGVTIELFQVPVAQMTQAPVC